MVAVVMLLTVHGGERSHALLLGDIKKLREVLRERFPGELKMNGTVFKEIWNFVDQLHAFRGTVDGSVVAKRTATEDGAQQAPRTRPSPEEPVDPLKQKEPIKATPTAPRIVPRKRAQMPAQSAEVQDESEDSEQLVRAIRAKSSTQAAAKSGGPAASSLPRCATDGVAE